MNQLVNVLLAIDKATQDPVLHARLRCVKLGLLVLWDSVVYIRPGCILDMIWILYVGTSVKFAFLAL